MLLHWLQDSCAGTEGRRQNVSWATYQELNITKYDDFSAMNPYNTQGSFDLFLPLDLLRVYTELPSKTSAAQLGFTSSLVLAISLCSHLYFDIIKRHKILDPIRALVLRCLFATACLILAVFVTPLLAILTLLLAFFRSGIHVFLRLTKPWYVELFEGLDAIWAVEEDTTRSVINALTFIQVDDGEEGKSLLSTFRKTFVKCLLAPPQPCPKIFYLRQKCLGYFYWERNRSMSIEEYVRPMATVGECSEFNEISEETLKNLVAEISNRALPMNHAACWEVLVGTQPIAQLAEVGKLQYPVMFRIHHSLGDGIALMQLLNSVLTDVRPPKTSSADTTWPTKCSPMHRSNKKSSDSSNINDQIGISIYKSQKNTIIEHNEEGIMSCEGNRTQSSLDSKLILTKTSSTRRPVLLKSPVSSATAQCKNLVPSIAAQCEIPTNEITMDVEYSGIPSLFMPGCTPNSLPHRVSPSHLVTQPVPIPCPDPSQYLENNSQIKMARSCNKTNSNIEQSFSLHNLSHSPQNKLRLRDISYNSNKLDFAGPFYSENRLIDVPTSRKTLFQEPPLLPSTYKESHCAHITIPDDMTPPKYMSIKLSAGASSNQCCSINGQSNQKYSIVSVDDTYHCNVSARTEFVLPTSYSKTTRNKHQTAQQLGRNQGISDKSTETEPDCQIPSQFASDASLLSPSFENMVYSGQSELAIFESKSSSTWLKKLKTTYEKLRNLITSSENNELKQVTVITESTPTLHQEIAVSTTTLQQEIPNKYVDLLHSISQSTCCSSRHERLADLIRTIYVNLIQILRGLALLPQDLIRTICRFTKSPANLIQTICRLAISPANLTQTIGALALLPASLIHQALMNFNDTSILHGPPLSGYKVVAWHRDLTGQLFNSIKRVKNCTSTRFTDVFLTALSASLETYFETYRASSVSKIPGNVTVVIPARMEVPEGIRMSQQKPRHTGQFSSSLSLNNRFSVAMLQLPVTQAVQESKATEFTPGKRLTEVHRQSEQLRNSVDYKVNYWLLKVVATYLPSALLSAVACSSQSTLVVSNIQGPAQELSIAGNSLRDVMFWVPNRGKTGIGITILSYEGRLEIGIMSDRSLIHCKEDAQMLLDETVKQLLRLDATLSSST